MTQPDSHSSAMTAYEFAGHDDLNLHLLSAHCNGSALGLTPEEAADEHHHEHYGPGGIRNHPFESRHFDPVKASTVIDECADMMGDDLAAGVASLLSRPTQVTRTSIASHTHRPATRTRPQSPACTTPRCDTYPRWVDVTVKRDGDGVFLNAESVRIDTQTDLLAHHLSAAKQYTNEASDRATGGAGFPVSYYLDRIHERLTVLSDLLTPAAATKDTPA